MRTSTPVRGSLQRRYDGYRDSNPGRDRTRTRAIVEHPRRTATVSVPEKRLPRNRDCHRRLRGRTSLHWPHADDTEDADAGMQSHYGGIREKAGPEDRKRSAPMASI